MRFFSYALLLIVTIPWLASAHAETLEESVARLTNSDFTDNEQRLVAIANELETLPQP